MFFKDKFIGHVRHILPGLASASSRSRGTRPIPAGTQRRHTSGVVRYCHASGWGPAEYDDRSQCACRSHSRNREIAGLHYPSDSLAGKNFAQEISAILNDET